MIEAARALPVRVSPRDRRLPAETMADLQPFLRILQPARWGGLELDPGVFFDVQIALATRCPSTAWVFGVLGVHNWQLALFDLRAQEEVWGEDPSARICSSYMPVGKVTPVDGGYRLSGRWAFSSGSDHCGWAFLGGFAPGNDMRTFLVPRRDFDVVDTWDVSGLRATGSNDVVVEEAFVPEHRTHRLVDGYLCKSGVHTAPLYRIPFGQIFVRSVSSTAIGIAEGALASYRDGVKGAISRLDVSRIAEDTAPQIACAQAATTIRELRLVLHANFAAMMTSARAGEPIPVSDRVQYRYESAVAVRRATEVVETLFHATAARALSLDSPMQRWFQDAQAARAHYANNPEKPGRNLGGVLLGLKNTDYFL